MNLEKLDGVLTLLFPGARERALSDSRNLISTLAGKISGVGATANGLQNAAEAESKNN